MSRRIKNVFSILGLAIIVMLILIAFKLISHQSIKEPVTELPDQNGDVITPDPQPEPDPDPETDEEFEVKRAKILANGDLLIHDAVYASAYDFDQEKFDFTPQFASVKDFLSSADLTIGNFEGSISDVYPFGGYPIFNAPIEIADAIKDTGYDVVSLANNHILDSREEGVYSTYNAFRDRDVLTVGVNINEEDRITVMDVNGIRVALLAYTYGYNGMEQTIGIDQYNKIMNPIDANKIYTDITDAKEVSDVIIVMPHMGVEYMLSPTQEQIDLYHSMIEWGADIILGNHSHVVQPTEMVERDGLEKFIIYSMGNFLSNQRVETVENIWTERGVIVELNLLMNQDKVVMIESVDAHPTWVSKVAKEPATYYNGIQQYDYQVLLTQDYLEDDHGLDAYTLERIRSAYYEVLELLDIK